MQEKLTAAKLMWFTPSQMAKLVVAADAENVSVAQIVRYAVDKYLANVKPEQPQPDNAKPAE